MITRLPSYQHEYNEYCSLDSAFVQRPDDPEAAKEYDAKLQRARETGDWSALVIEGQAPTAFVMQPVDRNVWRAVADRARLPDSSPRKIGSRVLVALLVRLAIKRIPGFDLDIKRAPDSKWEGWVMAQSELIDELDKINADIVTDLGDAVFMRTQGVSPL